MGIIWQRSKNNWVIGLYTPVQYGVAYDHEWDFSHDHKTFSSLETGFSLEEARKFATMSNIHIVGEHPRGSSRIRSLEKQAKKLKH